MGKGLLEVNYWRQPSRSLIQLCPYFTYWIGLGLRALFFFIYRVKTINFIEDLANYPYPPFFSSILLSLCSGKRKALLRTHHPRLYKNNRGGDDKMRPWAWSAAGMLWVLQSISSQRKAPVLMGNSIFLHATIKKGQRACNSLPFSSFYLTSCSLANFALSAAFPYRITGLFCVPPIFSGRYPVGHGNKSANLAATSALAVKWIA